jgi:hypothetical protein
MTRTKWMRLLVRDLGDVIRWAGAQNARSIGEFRYRVINGREIVTFRLVPQYAIRIGARDIIVVAHVRPKGLPARIRELLPAAKRAAATLGRRLRPGSGLPDLRPIATPAIAHGAEVRSLAAARRPTPRHS